MALRFRGSLMPLYGEGSNKISIKFHVGGKFIHTPEAMYQGGCVFIYDHVEVEGLSLLYLNCLCESCGFVGFIRYYRKDTDGFVLIMSDADLRAFCEKIDPTKEVDLYIDHDSSRINESEVSSSNGIPVDENENFIDGNIVDSDSENSLHENENISDSGSEDLDYSFNDVDYDMNEDDDLFVKNVDANEEWDGLHEQNFKNAKECVVDDDSCSGSKDLVESDGDIDSVLGSGSDDENPRKEKFMFNANRDMYDPDLHCGLSFKDFAEFKEAVRNYSIKRGRPVKFYKNDKSRCRAKCRSSGCKWDVYAKMMYDQRPMIRSFNSTHKCSFDVRNSSVTSKWVGKKYLKEFKLDPKLKIRNFIRKVFDETRYQISKWQAYRARDYALLILRDNVESQYAQLWNYIGELKRLDPEATIILKLSDTENADVLFDSERHETIVRPIGKPRFHRMYCCMSAMRNGFLAGCRPLFGIDGCHLKGQSQGVLLTAVGLDPNNNLFPIAYALVEGESQDSWSWFLKLLKEDLKIETENEHEWTIVSDKQKGLIGACDEVLSGADHRFCVRHMYANFVSAGFRGTNLKNALYEAATATTIPMFKKALEKISSIDVNALNWLKDKDAKYWSRSSFNIKPKCDMIVNNVCESFNSAILDARYLPIIQMFEWLRHYMMVRFQAKRDMARKKWAEMKICPKILRKLHENIEKGASCIAFKSSDEIFECEESDGRICIVNLRLRSCSCRKWDLSGIPCLHACAALSFLRKDHVDFVDGCYGVETFLRVYQFVVPAMTSSDNWVETCRVGPLPPLERVQAGRPKNKRRKSQGEIECSMYGGSKKPSSIKKLSRKGLVVACSLCKVVGHNIRRCPEKNQEVGGVDMQSTDTPQGRKRKSSMGLTQSEPSREISRDMNKASNTSQLGEQNPSSTAPSRRSPRKASRKDSTSITTPRLTKSTSRKVFITKSDLQRKKTEILEAMQAKRKNQTCNEAAFIPPSS